MPIKKRTNIPKAEPTVNVWSEYNQPGRPIELLIKEHDRLASDAAWDGDNVRAKHHEDIANRFRERLAEGELYDVDF